MVMRNKNKKIYKMKWTKRWRGLKMMSLPVVFFRKTMSRLLSQPPTAIMLQITITMAVSQVKLGTFLISAISRYRKNLIVSLMVAKVMDSSSMSQQWAKFPALPFTTIVRAVDSWWKITLSFRQEIAASLRRLQVTRSTQKFRIVKTQSKILTTSKAKHVIRWRTPKWSGLSNGRVLLTAWIWRLHNVTKSRIELLLKA